MDTGYVCYKEVENGNECKSVVWRVGRATEIIDINLFIYIHEKRESVPEMKRNFLKADKRAKH